VPIGMTQPIALDHSQNGQTKNNIVSLTVASARLLKLSKAFFDQGFCLVSLFGQLFPVQIRRSLRGAVLASLRTKVQPHHS
jgi:hypothetical protein